jgi:CBS domain-containing protein
MAEAELVTDDLAAEDPTYRIGRLAAAKRRPESVPPDASVELAVTMMLSKDFSQLPVMTSGRSVKGIISWRTIGRRFVLGKHDGLKGARVRDLMDNHQEISSESSLFRAIEIIVENQYVLIRGNDNSITGIVTVSDLSRQLRQLTEPFLRLSEIEKHIRRLLGDKFSPEELGRACDRNNSKRNVARVTDLTFGGYISLLGNDAHWKRLGIRIDRATFCKRLDEVRNIRNDVMHFDPAGIRASDLQCLRDFAHFLRMLHL